MPLSMWENFFKKFGILFYQINLTFLFIIYCCNYATHWGAELSNISIN